MSAKEEHSEHAHPTPLQYAAIALILAIITAIEVGVFYVEALEQYTLVVIAIFIILSAIKFALVVMFYMHLRYETKLFSGFFVGGVILATSVIIALMALFSVLLAAPTRAIPADSTGSEIFILKGCGACHTITGLSSGTVAPNLDNIGSTSKNRIAGLTGQEYLRASIENPGAFIVEGFPNAMPSTIRETLTDKELETLVAFLESQE
jgi:cytochrome c oxidase subunit 4